MVEVMPTPDKSEFDKKQYRVIQLVNGLKVLLVHDDEIRDDDSSRIYSNLPACSLKVSVGSSSDPSDFHGFSHFLGNTFENSENLAKQ